MAEESIVQLQAEVEKLRWMLETHLSDPVSYDKQAIMDDLARRWEEQHGTA